MRYRLLHIAVLALIGLVVNAQTIDVRSIFLESPDYVIPALTAAHKQELISLFEQKADGSDGAVQNIYGGESKVLRMTSGCLDISLDSTTDIQIKLLPLVNNTPLICMVVTSKIEPQQSVVCFYDMKWLSIDEHELLTIPDLAHFLNDPRRGEDLAVKSALSERGHLNYVVTCHPELPVISIRITTFDDEFVRTLHPEMAKLLNPDGVTMEWNKSHFELREIQIKYLD